MRALVVEESLATALVPARGGLVVVARARRRRGGWAALEADLVVEALVAAGPAAVVLARPAPADPGAAMLPGLARTMGRDVVRLPSDPAVAAWTLGVAAHQDFAGDSLVRRLEALAGAPGAESPLPRRRIGDGVAGVPALRPGVLSRWAACSWRACGHCSGGGPAGGRCGRCGTAGIAVAP